mmetsp:Transcript_10084/g.9091  ORF Transcript_10084/g.9091 Transcript_10084/m.9091 type:complete len:257 (+) Transcript_10084:2442-3212(+)
MSDTMTKELLFGAGASQIISPIQMRMDEMKDEDVSSSSDDEDEDEDEDMELSQEGGEGEEEKEEEVVKVSVHGQTQTKGTTKAMREIDDDDEKGNENDVVDVYAMMYQTMKDQNDYNKKDEHMEIIENSNQEQSKSMTLKPIMADDEDEDNRDSPIIKMDDDKSDHDDSKKDNDNNTIDIDINVGIDGPNISFAELSGYTNKPKADENFIPKLPFNVNWRNNNSPSIWVDNPYAKPSKSFKSKKYHKYKRGKSQRK